MLQQQFAGHTFRARGLLKVIAELPLLGKVHTFGLLLFAQLQAVTHDFSFAVFTVLARSEIAFLDGTLVAKAFRALEKQLHALTAAETTDRIGITCQVVFSLLDDRFTGLASPFFPDQNQWLVASG